MWQFALSRRWWAGHVLVLAGCALFLVLARWQWDRAHSVTGDWQNLGYALQWPVFAVFLVAAWLRFLWLEQHRQEPQPPALYEALDRTALDAPARGGTARGGTAQGRTAQPTRASVPARADRLTEDDPDDELAAYNAYLAQLAEQDRQR